VTKRKGGKGRLYTGYPALCPLSHPNILPKGSHSKSERKVQKFPVGEDKSTVQTQWSLSQSHQPPHPIHLKLLTLYGPTIATVEMNRDVEIDEQDPVRVMSRRGETDVAEGDVVVDDRCGVQEGVSG